MGVCIFFVASAAHAQVSTNAIAEDIRDIRGPMHIPYSWLWILWVAGGLIALALLFCIYRFWKNRRPVKIKLPHEIALERLEKARAWMKASQTREFSIAVSDAVRFYIEDRFHERAAHRTTDEFLRGHLSESSSPLATHVGLLEDFLRHCDMAKFARWSFAVSEMEAMHASARKFVEETRPAGETRDAGRETRDEKAQSPAPPNTPSTPPFITPTRP